MRRMTSIRASTTDRALIRISIEARTIPITVRNGAGRLTLTIRRETAEIAANGVIINRRTRLRLTDLLILVLTRVLLERGLIRSELDMMVSGLITLLRLLCSTLNYNMVTEELTARIRATCLAMTRSRNRINITMIERIFLRARLNDTRVLLLLNSTIISTTRLDDRVAVCVIRVRARTCT